jgi:hypothetical protein
MLTVAHIARYISSTLLTLEEWSAFGSADGAPWFAINDSIIIVMVRAM